MVKLYEVYVNNGLYYDEEDHYVELTVANSEEEAIENTKNSEFYYFDDDFCNPYFVVEEVSEVNGYKIVLCK